MRRRTKFSNCSRRWKKTTVRIAFTRRWSSRSAGPLSFPGCTEKQRSKDNQTVTYQSIELEIQRPGGPKPKTILVTKTIVTTAQDGKLKSIKEFGGEDMGLASEVW